MEESRPLYRRNYYKLFAKFVNSLDKQITTNLKVVGIETRSSQSNGLWCHVLLPVILVINTVLYKTSALYQIIAFISVGLFFHCSLFILFLSISGSVLMEVEYGGCLASSLISTMLIYIFTDKDLLPSLLITFSCVTSFDKLLKTVFIKFPKTFTLGEAIIVIQSIPLFVTASAMKFVHSLLNDIEEEFAFINILFFTVLITTGLIITFMFYYNVEHKNVYTLGYLVSVGASVLLLTWHIIIGPKCLIMIFGYIFMNLTRLKLIMFWASLSAMAIVVIYIRTWMSVKANTVTRKTFHVLASLVFISGMLMDVPLMTLAAGIGFSLLLFIEALRLAEIDQISPALQSAFAVYGDEKDSGAFAMTPMYLFTGLACPLVLVPSGASLDLLAGVLAVGVGDTAASCIGASLGKTHWPNSSRTLEGTAFNILSQVAVVYALEFFELLQVRYVLTRTVIAATASALVEAKTDQVDNLILPLITIIAFQSTWFLS